MNWLFVSWTFSSTELAATWTVNLDISVHLLKWNWWTRSKVAKIHGELRIWKTYQRKLHSKIVVFIKLWLWSGEQLADLYIKSGKPAIRETFVSEYQWAIILENTRVDAHETHCSRFESCEQKKNKVFAVQFSYTE